jgi:hypothetical protein
MLATCESLSTTSSWFMEMASTQSSRIPRTGVKRWSIEKQFLLTKAVLDLGVHFEVENGYVQRLRFQDNVPKLTNEDGTRAGCVAIFASPRVRHGFVFRAVVLWVDLERAMNHAMVCPEPASKGLETEQANFGLG